MDSVEIKTVRVTPASHTRHPLGKFSAVTVKTGDNRGLITVNNPRQAFISSDGNLTVQGPHGAKTTVWGDTDSDIVAFYENDKQVLVYDRPDLNYLMNALSGLL